MVDLSPWYRVCTKAMSISIGTYGYGEPRNVFHSFVQKPHLPVSAGKLPRLMWGFIRLRTETCVVWGGPITMVLCLHQGNMYIKRQLRVWRAQKCIPQVGAVTALTCAGWQTTLSHGRRCRAENRNLRKLGLTYHHGTVFPPKKYTGMESPEMY